jgi:hypothetical protein
MRNNGSRLRPSPALVIACLALFIAMGGVGYAAVKLGKGNVKTRNIKNGAVTAKKLAPGAVTAPKLAPAGQAVTASRFFFNTATTLDFGLQPGPSCDSRDVSVPGIQDTDYVVVTPPFNFPNTFTLEGHPKAGAVAVVSCNTFTGGGAVDPDGAGGPYKVLVIR